ncbi:MAG: FKBP-type peptidyl-prolyl cis-trans isomerase [Planctomycetota bacterium]
MPITVLSPYSGRAVKARDQDVGRALRDEEGRIFYIVERPEGQGYYAAPTRRGSDKDLERYDTLTDSGTAAASPEPESQGQPPAPPEAHDARGTGRKASPVRVIVVLAIVAAMGAAGYFAADRLELFVPAEPAPQAEPALPSPGSPPNPEPTSAASPAERTAAITAGSTGARPQAQHDPTRSLGGPAYVPPMDPDAAELDEGWTARPSGLRYRVVESGYGNAARAGMFVTAAYEVRVGTDAIVDSSRMNGPMRFVLWSGQALRAWDEAIVGMKIGETRELVIPPDLITQDDAFGEGIDGLTLRATVELLDAKPGVEVAIVEPGSGPRRVGPGDRIELAYVATVDGNPQPFASSDALGQPLRFVVGSGTVVPGLDMGVAGMAVGERRQIVIPAYLAYGSRGFGSLIPPDAGLLYDVTLQRVLDDN